MKKILTLLAVLVFAAGMALQAQQKAILRVADGQHLVKFPVVAADVIDADSETVIKKFDLSRKTKVQYYTIPVYVDSTAHPASDSSEYIPVVLQASYDDVTWTPLDTVDYYAIDGDTAFNFQDISTGTSAPFLRLYFDGSEGDSVNVTVSGVYGRFLDK